MALVVFLQEDEDVLSVYRNLKIFCETAPRAVFRPTYRLYYLVQKETVPYIIGE